MSTTQITENKEGPYTVKLRIYAAPLLERSNHPSIQYSMGGSPLALRMYRGKPTYISFQIVVKASDSTKENGNVFPIGYEKWHVYRSPTPYTLF